jgi:hypothetical protein
LKANTILFRPGGKEWVSLLGLMILVFIAFNQVLSFDFLNWDDDQYVLANKRYQPGTERSVISFFKGYDVGNYHPLTMLSYAIDLETSFSPKPFHRTNLLLHILNTLLAALSETYPLGCAIIGGVFCPASASRGICCLDIGQKGFIDDGILPFISNYVYPLYNDIILFKPITQLHFFCCCLPQQGNSRDFTSCMSAVSLFLYSGKKTISAPDADAFLYYFFDNRLCGHSCSDCSISHQNNQHDTAFMETDCCLL